MKLRMWLALVVGTFLAVPAYASECAYFNRAITYPNLGYYQTKNGWVLAAWMVMGTPFKGKTIQLPDGQMVTGVVPGKVPVVFMLYDKAKKSRYSIKSFSIQYVAQTREGDRNAELKDENQLPIGSPLNIPVWHFLFPEPYFYNSFDPSPKIFEVDLTLDNSLLMQFCADIGDRVSRAPSNLRKRMRVHH